MDQIQREKIIEKLAKIKALVERGVGGEKQTAQQMYEALKRRYGITDEEVNRATAVKVDINKIDLKQYWGIAFQLAVVVNTLHEENEICADCPYTYYIEHCEDCGTYWNIRDLQLEYETIQQRLVKAAIEVTG